MASPLAPRESCTEPRAKHNSGKHGDSSELPPMHIGPKEWHQAAQKHSPHESTRGPFLREDCCPSIWQPTAQQFTKTVRRLKRNNAADSGGWTTGTAQSCLEDARVRTLVLQWLRGQAVSTNPYAGGWGLIHFHKLVCIDKGQGSVRPILVGMLRTKVLSHLLLAQARPDLELFPQDRQFGIGTPRLEDHPDHIVANLEFKNASCSLKREHCMAVLQRLCPYNLAWRQTKRGGVPRWCCVLFFPWQHWIYKVTTTWVTLIMRKSKSISASVIEN